MLNTKQRQVACDPLLRSWRIIQLLHGLDAKHNCNSYSICWHTVSDSVDRVPLSHHVCIFMCGLMCL